MGPKKEIHEKDVYIGPVIEQYFYFQFFRNVNKNDKKLSVINYIKNKYKVFLHILLNRIIIVKKFDNTENFNNSVNIIRNDLLTIYNRGIPIWNILLDHGFKDSRDVFPAKQYKLKAESYLVKGIIKYKDETSEDGKMIEYEFEKDKFYFFTPGCDQNCDIIKKIMFEEAQIKMKSNITNDMMNIKTESKYAAIS